jgi:signal transduction histidine kinase
MAWTPRWLRARMGVRVASALSAAAVVALALVIGGAALVLLVDRSLTRSVQDDALQRASAIADRMHGNYGRKVKGDDGEPVYVPEENAAEALDALARGDDQITQILIDYSSSDEGDYIVSRVNSAPTKTPIADLRPYPGQTDVDSSLTVPDQDGDLHHVVVAAAGGVTTTPEPVNFVVLYAASLGPVDAARETVLKGLLLGVPILILVAGAATYVFAGRALRPVEVIRARVASMTEKDLSQRVPVPGTRDEIGRLAETMNGMIARLEDAQDVQRRFVADASHELRSPLATIGAGLELLHGTDPTTVGTLRGETARLGKLVDDLLLLARADERGIRPHQEEVDLDEIAEAERARPTDGSAVTEVRAAHVRVVGDRGQLVRVLRNLVDNAHRHARERVLVSVARDGDEAVMQVADDGPGIPEADWARVFERFVRLDDARARADGGSGLGLAIVAEVVAAHGGTVGVGAAESGGALFTVRLPAAAVPLPEPDESPAGDEPAAVQEDDVQREESPGDQDDDTPATGVPVGVPLRGITGREIASHAGAAGGSSAPSPSRPVRPPVADVLSRAGAEDPVAWVRPVPVTDTEARRDPLTSPAGIPAVRPSDETAPQGIPVQR